MYIFKIYFLENDNVNFVVSSLCFISLLISVWKFPTNLGDGLLAFAGYIALACAPSSFLVLILAKILAEFLIGAKDFMKLAKRDPIEEGFISPAIRTRPALFSRPVRIDHHGSRTSGGFRPSVPVSKLLLRVYRFRTPRVYLLRRATQPLSETRESARRP